MSPFDFGFTIQQELAAAREKQAQASALLPEAVSLERDFADFTALMDEVDALGGEDLVNDSAHEEASLNAQLSRMEAKLADLSRQQQDSDVCGVSVLNTHSSMSVFLCFETVPPCGA